MPLFCRRVYVTAGHIFRTARKQLFAPAHLCTPKGEPSCVPLVGHAFSFSLCSMRAFPSEPARAHRALALDRQQPANHPYPPYPFHMHIAGCVASGLRRMGEGDAQHAWLLATSQYWVAKFFKISRYIEFLDACMKH
jgi:hypothetical protein